MSFVSECSVHGVAYEGYRCPQCQRDSDKYHDERRHQQERIQDAEQAEALFSAAQVAEEARHRERLRAEEERWLFSQPEDVRQKWLEKKAAEAAAAKAAEQALAFELQRIENIQRVKMEALDRLNEPVRLWGLNQQRRETTATGKSFLYSVALGCLFVFYVAYWVLEPSVRKKFSFGLDIPGETYLFILTCGAGLGYAFWCIIPKSLEKFVFARPSPRPTVYSLDDLDDQGNPTQELEERLNLSETEENVSRRATQPTDLNAKCPNCESLINDSIDSCWKCKAVFDSGSTWKPIPLK
jgi:hypothetical protein